MHRILFLLGFVFLALVGWETSVHASQRNLGEVFQAIEDDNLERFKRLVDRLPVRELNRGYSGSFGETPLIATARFERLEMLQHLLTKPGLCIDCVDDYRRTALIEATIRNNLAILNELLRKGANANFRGRYGRTALHFAVAEGYTEIVKRLLEVDGIAVNERDDNGRTPLLVAFDDFANPREELEVIDEELGEIFVLEANLHLEIRRMPLPEDPEEREEVKSLKAAVAFMDLVRVMMLGELLKAGADPNLLDHSRRGPLMAAAETGQEPAYFLLRLGGARTKEAVTRDGKTVLMASAASESARIFNALLEEAELDLNEVDFFGRTALHYTVQEGLSAWLKRMIDRGANVNIQDDDGLSPVMLAIVHNCMESVRCLVELGADLSLEDVDGDNSLHLAAYTALMNDDPSLFDFIAEIRPELEKTTNKEGRTPREVLLGRGTVIH